MQKLVYIVPLLAAALLVRVPGRVYAAEPTSAAVATLAATTLLKAQDLGAAADARVDFSVVLPYRHSADLPYLLAAQEDPTSRYYRRFLSAAEFRTYFSPDQPTYDATARKLVRAGFSVETFANRTVLHASGKASAAERYFHTVIHRVRQGDGKETYANVASATLPAELAGAQVAGLSSIAKVNAAARRPNRISRSGSATGGRFFGPDGGYGPLAIAKAEDFPVEHGYLGKNSKVADLIDGALDDRDVATFLQAFGEHRAVPRTKTVKVDGGCGYYCQDAYLAAIDAEWVLAMAPAASLYSYQIPQLNNGAIVDGFNAIASDDAVDIVHIGFATCETDSVALEIAVAPLIAQGVAEGITYEGPTETFLSPGGSNICELAPLDLPSFPADLDTLTAVGGNSTYVDPSGKQLEAFALSISNGGVSVLVPRPRWQAVTPGTSRVGRNAPDLTMPASVDGVGPSAYFQGEWEGGNATINDATFAGFLATVHEMYGHAKPLGNVAPALYSSFNRYGYGTAARGNFMDVIVGCLRGAIGKPVCAKPGYDVVGGIGAIHSGYALARSLGLGKIVPPTR